MNIIHKLKNAIQKIKTSFIVQLLICTMLCGIIIVVSLIYNRKIDIEKFRKYIIVNDIKLINSVEKINIDDRILQLEGYAFYLEQDSKNTYISLFLRNLKNQSEVWMDAETLARPDVQNYYSCEYNYENSGFIATSNQKNLNMEDCYEIFINLDIIKNSGEKLRKTVTTGKYIYNGKLLDYNPYDFSQPYSDLQSELLDRIFLEGKLQFSSEDIGIYIYEYQDKLYWITSEKFQFNENGKTYIPYQLWTSQISKLPEKRIPHGYDNLLFYFEEYELIDEQSGPYRIAARDIPNSYAITFVKTGVYDIVDNKWLWSASFQLGIN